MISDVVGTSAYCAFGGWVMIFAGLLRWRFTESMDDKSNNHGLYQWSSNFYRKGGALMDFWNALPHIVNLTSTATVYLGQLKDGSYKTIFPSGANNISSVYKKIGEGHYEAGSQMAQDIDINEGKGGSVWEGDGVGVHGAKQD